jgi:DNA-binding NarL/FixJ family response regulator
MNYIDNAKEARKQMLLAQKYWHDQSKLYRSSMRKCIKELKKLGYSQREIARQLNINEATIRSIIKSK